MIDKHTKEVLARLARRALERTPENVMVIAIPRYDWLPRWFMRWTWFRVVKVIHPPMDGFMCDCVLISSRECE